MYRETPGVHTPAGPPATTVPADTAQLLFRAAASTGEGAIWHPGRRSLLWVDIEGKTLHEYVPPAFGKVSCGTGELMSGTKPAGSDTLRTVMTVPSVTRRWDLRPDGLYGRTRNGQYGYRQLRRTVSNVST